jgi:hypothetical protein
MSSRRRRQDTSYQRIDESSQDLADASGAETDSAFELHAVRSVEEAEDAFDPDRFNESVLLGD